LTKIVHFSRGDDEFTLNEVAQLSEIFTACSEVVRLDAVKVSSHSDGGRRSGGDFNRG